MTSRLDKIFEIQAKIAEHDWQKQRHQDANIGLNHHLKRRRQDLKNSPEQEQEVN